MPKSPKKKLTAKNLLKKRFPHVLIPGLIAAGILGWSAKALIDAKNYHQLKQLFPASGVVTEIVDGDTFVLKNGVKVRLLGIDAPAGKTPAEDYLTKNIIKKKVYLEYDRYQDDPYGRVLAWVWVDCETTPEFLPADYMHKSDNESNPGLSESPKGCKKGKLINEQLVIKHYAEPEVYKDRGELKYQNRISKIR
jgi:hypothetical protein